MDGLSMGASVVMAAAELDLPDNVRGIIADCGYTSMRGIFDKIIREWFHLPPFPLVPLTDLYCRVRHGFGFSDVNSAETLAHATVPVLLDFWAPWCGPCRRVVPLVEEIAEERADIKVGKVNVEEQPELARQFGVKSIPMLVVMKDGEVIKRSVGAKNKSAILAML